MKYLLLSASLIGQPIHLDNPAAIQAPHMGTPVDAISHCGSVLLGLSGKPDSGLDKLYLKASISKDTEFMTYLLAVIYVESHFNKQAVSEQEARGLMQMTSIAVDSATQHCKFKSITSDHLFDSYTNIKYGSCYLKKMLDESNGDWTKALILYNGGYRQLTKYMQGDDITTETANYILKVNRARELCLQTN